MSAMVCTYREGVWTECWRISLCLNGRQGKRKDNPTHAATHAVSHRGRLREILQTATHVTGAQIANRIRAHAGTHAVTHAVSHRGRPAFFCTSIVVINIRLSAYISKAVIIGCRCNRMCKCGADSSVYIWRAVTSSLHQRAACKQCFSLLCG